MMCSYPECLWRSSTFLVIVVSGSESECTLHLSPLAIFLDTLLFHNGLL